MFLDCFAVFMLKINFLKNKKYYFNTFSCKKYLKKQSLSQSQTLP